MILLRLSTLNGMGTASKAAVKEADDMTQIHSPCCLMVEIYQKQTRATGVICWLAKPIAISLRDSMRMSISSAQKH